MEAIKDGVDAERLAAQTTSTTSVTSGIPVYVGTAPVHMTKESAVNTPGAWYIKGRLFGENWLSE